MFESVILLTSLLLGYHLFNCKKNLLKIIKIINLLLGFVIVSIIFIMGYNFSIFAQTNSVVFKVIGISIVYTAIIFVMNILGLYLLCLYNNCKEKFTYSASAVKKENLLLLLLKSSKYILYLIAGFVIGEYINIDLTYILDNLIFIFLLALMVIIGILLKLENIPISQIFKNKLAIIIVNIVITTSMLSGVIISLTSSIPMKESIMVSSGLGWYSLSVVLNTQFIGEYYGVITFLTDFSREVIVLVTLPLLRSLLSVELVGYAANTAMDFCLPVIRNNLGTKIVPLAISVGLLLTIITPFLLLLENMVL